MDSTEEDVEEGVGVLAVSEAGARHGCLTGELPASSPTLVELAIVRLLFGGRPTEICICNILQIKCLKKWQLVTEVM